MTTIVARIKKVSCQRDSRNSWCLGTPLCCGLVFDGESIYVSSEFLAQGQQVCVSGRQGPVYSVMAYNEAYGGQKQGQLASPLLCPQTILLLFLRPRHKSPHIPSPL